MWRAWTRRRCSARWPQGVTIGSNGVSYTPLDMTARGLAQIARASVSYLTTQDEIGRLLDALRQLPRQG